MGLAQEATPEPTPTAEATEVVPETTVTTVTVTTEPVVSGTVQAFIAALSGMIIDVVVPLLAMLALAGLYRLMQWVQTMLSAEQEALLSRLVNMVVQAAEQTGLAQEIKMSGEQKKTMAISLLQDALRLRGLGVLADSVPELSARIEAAINQEVQKPFPGIATVEAISQP